MGGTDSRLLSDLLRRCAARWPEKVALICDEQELTFHALDAQSDRLAGALQCAGVRRGDRVAIFMDNSPELVIALFGISKAGAVFVPINSTTRSEKLAYILNDCSVRALIAHRNQAPAVRGARGSAPSLQVLIWSSSPGEPDLPGRDFAEIIHETDQAPADPGLIDQDLCAIIYTSGSTGQPKGVMLTHQNIVSTAGSIGQYLDNRADDVVCCVLPLAFSYGLYQVFVMALLGYTLVLERSFAFPIHVLRRMEKHRVTGLPGVPSIFATLLQVAPSAGIDLSTLRYMTNAAGPMSPTQVSQISAMFPAVRFFSMYGQTECARACYLSPERVTAKPGSVGRAIPNTELFLVDEQGCRAGPNQVGELVVRGANVMRGYWNLPEITERKLRDGHYPGEKVLFTGDLFRMDEEGDLYFVSRTDDIIKCKGEKVSPKEVEDVLYALPGVAEATVVGVDDAFEGQAIKACIVPQQGAVLTVDQVRRHCRGHLEGHMVPKFVELLSSLPKTPSGKICKRDIQGAHILI